MFKAVITGGPCVGKTTLVESLQKLGYPVVAEAASQLIREGEFHPERDREAFQKQLLCRQLQLEAQLADISRTVFFDRGLFDACAYYQADGREVPDFLLSLDRPRYNLAFLLEPLAEWVNDGVRSEDLAFTQKITPIMEYVYTQRGVTVIRVPATSVSRRLSFVLATLGRSKQGSEEAVETR